MGSRRLKRCLTPYVIRELQINIKMIFHYTPIRMAKILTKYQMPVKMWNSFIAGKNAKCCSHFDRQFGSFLWNETFLPCNSTIPFLSIYQNKLETYPHNNLHTDVYNSFILNCQNLRATKMFFSRLINCGIPHNGILLSFEKHIKS
jgi:hypothetical protein